MNLVFHTICPAPFPQAGVVCLSLGSGDQRGLLGEEQPVGEVWGQAQPCWAPCAGTAGSPSLQQGSDDPGDPWITGIARGCRCCRFHKIIPEEDGALLFGEPERSGDGSGHLLWPLGSAAHPGTLLQMIFTLSPLPPSRMGQLLSLWLGVPGEAGQSPPSPAEPPHVPSACRHTRAADSSQQRCAVLLPCWDPWGAEC